VLLAVPIIHYQMRLEKSPPMSIELPSTGDPPAAAIPPAEAPDGSASPPMPAPTKQDSSKSILRLNRERLDRLQARAAKVQQALSRIKRESAAQGLPLRADLVAAERRMEAYLEEANAASKAADADRMERSLDRAEDAIDDLEEFLDF
jgi:hypothetical protein